MKIRLIAIALTMLMIISGFAVLVSYAPANNSNPVLVSPMANIQTNNTAYEYPITLTFNEKTNRSVFTDVRITVNLAGSVAFVDKLFSNLYFIDSNGVGEPMFIISGSTTGNVTFITETPFTNSTVNLVVLPSMYNELGSNVFLAPTIDNDSYSDAPSGLFLEYKSFGSTTEGSVENPAYSSSTTNVGGSGINFYTSVAGSAALNKYQQQYEDFWIQVTSADTLDVVLYYPLTNEGSNVSYGYMLSGFSPLSTYVATNGFVSGASPYVNPVMAQNTSESNSNYSFSVNGVYDYLGSYQTGDLVNWNVSNNQTTVWNGTYSHVFNTVDTSSMALGTATNGNINSNYPGVYFYYVYAMRYHSYTSFVSSQVRYGITTSSSTGNYILFNETGLPYGQSWNVSLTNRTANVVNSVYASTTQTAKVFLPTGYNYSFSFSTLDKSYYKIVNLTGNVYLSPKANATVNITLTNVSYDVVFHESGLLSGNAWGIKFNGTDYNTTSASLTFIEKNGSYPFTVIISKLYNSNVSSGYANVSGQSLNFYIGFTYHAFNITFSEVGLPSDVQWSMTINGTVYYSNVSDSNILLFQGKAGSYDGIVNNASYYTPVTKYFNFTISGNAQYTIDYGIILTFIESGYNGLWHITINGVTYSSSTNTIVATVSPGQVIFNVWGISGYTINPEVVTQSYTSAQTIRVAFTVQPASFENILISTPMVILYFVLAIMTMAGVVYWRLKHER